MKRTDMKFVGKTRIRIEQDGWVWIKNGRKNIGLGDIDVDVVLEDHRPDKTDKSKEWERKRVVDNAN